MSDPALLQKNLRALSSSDPELAYKILSSERAENVIFKKGRDFPSVPFVKAGENFVSLCSLFSSEAESRKIFNSFKQSGFTVFFGFGAGRHIVPFLQKREISGILVIDYDVKYFRAIFEEIDLTGFFSNKKFHLLVDPSPEEIKDHILKNFFPALSGGFQIIPLKNRTNQEKSFFLGASSVIEETLNMISGDYTVQSLFGRRWFKNIIGNIKRSAESKETIPPQKKVLITGAGPSLEMQIEEIRREKKSGFLIASDTSFPALMENGIEPDAVISIDCQHITYSHFFKKIPKQTKLVLDLASPVFLSRLSEKTIFFISGHPLSLFVGSRWRDFPHIDTSGGNVSHAALSLASSLNAEEIHIFGLDFSYPDRKSYARGCYIYDNLGKHAGRYSTLEHLMFSFSSHAAPTEKNDGHIVYSTKMLEKYHESFMNFAEGNNLNIVMPEKSAGRILDIKPGGGKRVIHPFFAAGEAKCHWKKFLSDYKDLIEALPENPSSFGEYYSSLDESKKDLFLTLLPGSANIRKSYFNDDASPAEVIKFAKRWSIGVIENALRKR